MRTVAVFVIAVAALAVQIVRGQNCNDQLLSFSTCIQQSRERLIQNLPNPENIDAQLTQCFTSNGCRDPSTGLSGFDVAAETGIEGEEVTKVVDSQRQCAIQFRARLRTSLESCVQRKTRVAYKFPVGAGDDDSPAEETSSDDERRLATAKGLAQVVGKARKLFRALSLSDVCPSQYEASAAANCISKTFDSLQSPEACLKNPFEMILDAEAAWCEVRRQCQSQMTSECKNQLETVKKTICDCATELSRASTGSSLKAQYDQCIRSGTATQSAGGRVRTSDYQRLMTAQVTKFCQRASGRDSCATAGALLTTTLGPVASTTQPNSPTTSDPFGGLLGGLGNLGFPDFGQIANQFGNFGGLLGRR